MNHKNACNADRFFFDYLITMYVIESISDCSFHVALSLRSIVQLGLVTERNAYTLSGDTYGL